MIINHLDFLIYIVFPIIYFTFQVHIGSLLSAFFLSCQLIIHSCMQLTFTEHLLSTKSNVAKIHKTVSLPPKDS